MSRNIILPSFYPVSDSGLPTIYNLHFYFILLQRSKIRFVPFLKLYNVYDFVIQVRLSNVVLCLEI